MQSYAHAAKARKEMREIVTANGARAVLVDIRRLKGRHLVETYYGVRNCPDELRHLIIAVVDTEENASFESFSETASYNAGRVLTAFTDINEAKNWLRDKLKKP